MEIEPKSTAIQDTEKADHEEPQIIQEIIVEELSIDGVCGVY
jgi:mycofactocin precursor